MDLTVRRAARWPLFAVTAGIAAVGLASVPSSWYAPDLVGSDIGAGLLFLAGVTAMLVGTVAVGRSALGRGEAPVDRRATLVCALAWCAAVTIIVLSVVASRS